MSVASTIEKLTLRDELQQTQIGKIPADWELSTLDELSVVGSGKRLPKGALLVEHVTPHPYIRVTDMRPSTVDTSNIQYVPESVAPSIKRYRIFCSDIFVSVAGTLGLVGIVPPELDGANLTENADRITQIRCSQRYLMHVLLSPIIQDVIDEMQTVGAQPKLALTRLRKFLIPVPPTIEEQEAIATALSDADGLVEALESLIAKKRAVKQGAMQELLSGRTRLPGFSEGWTNVPIGNLCEVVNGLTYTPSDVRQAGTLVLRSSNIQDDMLNLEDNVFVQMDIPERTLAKIGDILICVRNGSRDLIGKCVGLDERCQGMAFGAFMAVLRTPRHRFILHQFRSDGMKRQIAEHLGATINQITNKSLRSFMIHVPSTEAEATAVANVLSDMDDELAALQTRLTKARAIKQGMMQELLTGRIRLI